MQRYDFSQNRTTSAAPGPISRSDFLGFSLGMTNFEITGNKHHQNQYAMKLDKEQKRVLKAGWPTWLTFIIGYPLVSLIRGKADWKEALLLFAGGLVVAVLMTVFYVLGSKIPTKDE